MRKRLLAVALSCFFLCSPASAKTFVGVLWPMFGPLPAIGLVELVAELKMMPDVEVETYVHQAWPSLIDDLERQPKGTHTVVIGYSLGANATVFVANRTYVDLIIALQPSMLSWVPDMTGHVGRMIEIYNPNPWMTFGGMGSRKLIGPNIEYIENNDSHPGAQFNLGFRALVKDQVAKISTQNDVTVAEATPANRPPPPQTAPDAPKLAATEKRVPQSPKPAEALKLATATEKRPLQSPKPTDALKLAAAAEKRPQPTGAPKLAAATQTSQRPQQRREDTMAFLDTLSRSVDSGNLTATRTLTVADLKDYAERTYPSRRADAF